MKTIDNMSYRLEQYQTYPGTLYVTDTSAVSTVKAYCNDELLYIFREVLQ